LNVGGGSVVTQQDDRGGMIELRDGTRAQNREIGRPTVVHREQIERRLRISERELRRVKRLIPDLSVSALKWSEQDDRAADVRRSAGAD
jgi:hypothetical protein